MTTDRTSLRAVMDRMKPEPQEPELLAEPDPDCELIDFTWTRRSSWERDKRFICNGPGITAIRDALNSVNSKSTKPQLWAAIKAARSQL